MPVVTKVGTFTLSGATGNQTIAHGLGALPKLVFMTFVPKTTFGFHPSLGNDITNIGGGVFNDKLQQYAWSDVTREAGFTGAPIQRVGGRHQADRCLILVPDVTGFGTPNLHANSVESSIVSVNATNFTLNHNVTDGGAYQVIYYAIGGGDIVDTAIGLTSVTNTANVVSQVATGFEPEFVVLMAHTGTTAHRFGTAFTTQCGYVQWNTSANDKWDDGFADAMSVNTRAFGYGFDGVYTLNTYANGFTMVCSPGACPSGNAEFGYVAIYGGSHHVTPVAGVSGPTQVVTGFPVKGIMAHGNGSLAAPYSATTSARQSLGFYDGTNQRAASYVHGFGQREGNFWISDTGFNSTIYANSATLESVYNGVELSNAGSYSYSVASANGHYATIWAIGPGKAGAGGCGAVPRVSYDDRFVK